MTRTLLSLLAACAPLLMLSGRASALFLSLGPLTVEVADLSAFGSAAVGATVETPAPGPEAFRWTPEAGIAGLGDLPGDPFWSRASAVSADGSVVVGTGTTGPPIPTGSPLIEEAFRWTPAGGMVGLGNLPGGDAGSSAFDVSADGATVVGVSEGSSGAEAFRWTPDCGMSGLGDLPGGSFNSSAHGVSADGSIVVGGSSDAPRGFHAFRWTADSGMVDLGDLIGGAGSSVAWAVSDDGSVVVGRAFGTDVQAGSEAFYWTSQGGMTGLGALPGTTSSEAFGMTSDGSIVIGESYPQSFVWDEAHGMRPLVDVFVDDYGLDLSGWSELRVAAISPDGSAFAGSGVRGGQREVWLAIIPEPGTGILLACGIAALSARRSRWSDIGTTERRWQARSRGCSPGARWPKLVRHGRQATPSRDELRSGSSPTSGPPPPRPALVRPDRREGRLRVGVVGLLEGQERHVAARLAGEPVELVPVSRERLLAGALGEFEALMIATRFVCQANVLKAERLIGRERVVLASGGQIVIAVDGLAATVRTVSVPAAGSICEPAFSCRCSIR